jgi:hypothetical protein
MEVGNSVSTINVVKQDVGKEKKKSQSKKFVAGMVASTAGTVVSQSSLAGSLALIGGYEKLQSKLKPSEIKLIKQAGDDAFKQMGLDKHGVKIVRLAKNGKKPNLIQKIAMFANPLQMQECIKNGYNGCFHPLLNQIIIPENRNIPVVFHEMGHAFNRHCTKFWKGVQGLRSPLMILTALPMTIGAFTTQSKAEDGKELTKTQKAKNFVRDNAGKLTFCAMLPVIAEEAMATIRGQKYANKLLPKNLAKHVGKSNLLGLGSYILSATLMALGSTTSVKVKDAMDNKAQK